MTLGNSVAEYRVTRETCGCCGGNGEITTGNIFTPREVMDKLFDGGWLKQVSLRGRVDMMEDLTKVGSTVCPNCDGKGDTEVWR